LAVYVWFDNMYIAMLPILENAQQTLLSAKQLETENCQLKAAIEQHESDAKRQGNALQYSINCLLVMLVFLHIYCSYIRFSL